MPVNPIKFSAVAVQIPSGPSGRTPGQAQGTLNTLRMKYHEMVRSGHACPNDVFILGTRDDHKNTRTPDRRYDRALVEAIHANATPQVTIRRELAELEEGMNLSTRNTTILECGDLSDLIKKYNAPVTPENQ